MQIIRFIGIFLTFAVVVAICIQVFDQLLGHAKDSLVRNGIAIVLGIVVARAVTKVWKHRTRCDNICHETQMSKHLKIDGKVCS